MDSKLKSKICESFNLSTLISEEPPPKIRNRLSLLRGIFVNHPPPQDSGAYLLVNYPKNPVWEKLEGVVAIGNSSESHIRLDYPTVSRKHCQLKKTDHRWHLADLESANGVYVNGEKIAEKYLVHGDIIQTGTAMLVFIDNEGCSDSFLPERP